SISAQLALGVSRYGVVSMPPVRRGDPSIESCRHSSMALLLSRFRPCPPRPDGPSPRFCRGAVAIPRRFQAGTGRNPRDVQGSGRPRTAGRGPAHGRAARIAVVGALLLAAVGDQDDVAATT